MKYLFYTFIISFAISSNAYAGCGACNVSNNKASNPLGDFITIISEKGEVSGLVLASCGMCNFGMKNNRGCSLAIQVNETAYDVKGTGIDDHGDSHAKDGFCNAIRIANVDGEIKDNFLIANSFTLKNE